MGNFAAYDFDEKLDAALTAASINDYYRMMLRNAFNNAFEPMSSRHGRYSPLDPHAEQTEGWAIGTVSADMCSPPGPLFGRIAEQERRYYFRWVEGEAPEKDTSPQSAPKFLRIDAVSLRNLNTSKLKAGAQARSGYKSLPADVSSTLNCESPRLFLTKDHMLVVAHDAALYFDANTESSSFRFTTEHGKFIKIRAWRPRQAPRTLDLHNPTPAESEYFEANGSCNELSSPNEKVLSRRELMYLYDGWWGHQLPPRPQFQSVFAGKEPDKLTTKLNELVDSLGEAATQVRQDAANNVRTIPTGFRCFYFRNEAELDGIITDAKLASESRAAGRYEMRADPVAELDYRWGFLPRQQLSETIWSRLVATIIGLDPAKKINDCVPGGAPGFSTTNTPFSTRIVFQESHPTGTHTIRVGVRLLYYYKNLSKPTDAALKVNRPARARNPNPHLRYAHKGRRLTPAMFLKWKKGDGTQGESWGTNTTPRQQAGLIMARALRAFEFYEKARENPAIGPSHLPATQFADYVIAHGGVPETWRNAYGNQPLRADQEWCHLLGHGDGGQAILDNFVSGSEHCNTEQLAIEMGQRRVTQYEAIDEGVRRNFTWKITAHLVPNSGSHIAEYEALVTEYLNGGQLSKDAKQKILESGANGKQLSLNLLTQLIKDFRTAMKTPRAGPPDTDLATRNRATMIDLMNFLSWYQRTCRLIFPLAQCIHYRIFYRQRKCFEHYFDAQGESFDVNEAKILDYTVERALYRALQEDPTVSINREQPMAHYMKLLLNRAANSGRKIGSPKLKRELPTAGTPSKRARFNPVEYPVAEEDNDAMDLDPPAAAPLPSQPRR